MPYFQIDNEPMNNNFTAGRYAAVVNVYGSQLRKIAPGSRIIACGQKRSNDMAWSQTVIDLAGANFDTLGVHNYEYESDRYQEGVQRIGDYLRKLRDYLADRRIQASNSLCWNGTSAERTTGALDCTRIIVCCPLMATTSPSAGKITLEATSSD